MARAKATLYPTKIWWWIATWFGCGLSPFFSGTMGSLGALPFAYVIQLYCGNVTLFMASVAIFIVGCQASNHYLRETGRDDDPKEIVVDEVAGQWLLLSALPPLTWHAYLVGFLLFRCFDMIKPWPISVADEKIKGGFGVMFDDILAALYPMVVYVIMMIGCYCFGNQDMLTSLHNFLAAQ